MTKGAKKQDGLQYHADKILKGGIVGVDAGRTESVAGDAGAVEE